MWKKEDAKPQGVSDSLVAPVSSAPVSSNNPVSTPATPAAIPVSPRAQTLANHRFEVRAVQPFQPLLFAIAGNRATQRMGREALQ